MTQLLLASVLALPIGLTVGVLGGGGSVLTVPLLVYGVGLGRKEAIATSLLVLALTGIAAAIPHARAGNLDLRTALTFGVFAALGSYVGGRLAQFIPGPILLLIFAGLMLFTAVGMWRGRRAPAKPNAPRTSVVAGQAFTIGVLTGLVGAGGGFLFVPVLVLFGGLSMRQAVGTSLAVVATNSLAGFAGHLAHVVVRYDIAAVVAFVSIIGALLGARLSQRIPQEKLRRGFAVFVAIMGTFIAVREGYAQFVSSKHAAAQGQPLASDIGRALCSLPLPSASDDLIRCDCEGVLRCTTPPAFLRRRIQKCNTER